MINKKWQGKFIIKTKDGTEIINNKVMDTALSRLVKALSGNSDIQIKYLALGTSDTPVTISDTKLGNEIFRTLVSNQELTGVGELTTDFVILDNEAVGSIREMGIFGGSTATSAANSGILISRILWSKEKTNSEEINIKRIDHIGRG